MVHFVSNADILVAVPRKCLEIGASKFRVKREIIRVKRIIFSQSENRKTKGDKFPVSFGKSNFLKIAILRE